jgi:hypothetical protein
MKPVYICEDYKIENRVLIIWKPTLVGMVFGPDNFKKLISTLTYDAVICPELYYLKNNDVPEVDYVVFK